MSHISPLFMSKAPFFPEWWYTPSFNCYSSDDSQLMNSITILKGPQNESPIISGSDLGFHFIMFDIFLCHEDPSASFQIIFFFRVFVKTPSKIYDINGINGDN